MSAPVTNVARLARTWRVPRAEVRAAVLDLVEHWGRERVLADYDAHGGMRLTPAATVAVRRSFGIGGAW